jgi:hypothetical protein
MTLKEHQKGTCDPDSCGWCQAGMPQSDDPNWEAGKNEGGGGGKWSDVKGQGEEKSR